jgi:RNA ligase
MNYAFPMIRNIDDVLPHIKGRDEFLVAEREFGTVINYMVSMPDTFNMTGPDDLGGAIRRECRGIKFYPDGKVACRLFHKFFNISEREETQPHLIDLSRLHTIMDKRDGSMLHPMVMPDGKIRWMTKMGLSDVAIQAEKFIQHHPKYENFAMWCINNDMTPIFEYTSPNNRIVIQYEKEELILLAVRNNFTGEYLNVTG